MESFFTPDNWNTCRYQNKDQFAFISLLADPENEDGIMYCVTVLDEDHNEIFQQPYGELLEACQQINANYGGIWDFKNLSLSQNTGGCSTCQAH